MELKEFLEKENELASKELKLQVELSEVYNERSELYKTACKHGIYWQSTEKVWYKED